MELYNQYSGKLGLICFAIYLIMVVRGRKVFSGDIGYSNKYFFVGFWMALYAVLGFLAHDTYHYSTAYSMMLSDGMKYGVEDFYFWLVEVLPNSYILWRVVVWGGASVLMIWSAKLLNLNSNVLWLMVPLLFLNYFHVTRGCLGISLMIFSSLVFIQALEKRKILICLIAILGIVVSSFLHKSLIIFIAILLVAYLFPMNKKTFVALLVLFPVLYFFVLKVFADFSFWEYLNEEQIYLISSYQSSQKTEANIYGILSNIFAKGSLILLLLGLTKKILYDKIQCSKSQFFIFKYTFLMIYVSFLFFGQQISIWVSYRTLHAGSFAMVLCATQCFDPNLTEKKRTTMESVILICFLISTIFNQMSFIIKMW